MNKNNKKRKKYDKNNKFSNEIIKDKRFKHVHNDPRFIKVPQKIRKTAIDSRFKGMFTDNKFKTDVKVDKYGNRLEKNDDVADEMKKFYRLEEEEEEKKMNENKNNKSSNITLDASSSSSSDSNSSSSGSSSDDSDSDFDLNMDSLVDEETLQRIRNQLVKVDEVKLMNIEDATKRLAVVNLEWSQITSTDLLVLFQSFLQGTGANVKSVTIYPSDYGIEKLKKERDHGPVELFEADRKLKEEKKKKMKAMGIDNDNDEEDELDTELLRAYEKDRQNYYYAVLECDSTDTAKRLYSECDGLEFERSSNVLDLRFIPDDVKFENEPRDTATDVPANYEAPDFYSAALQKTNLELSWDNDEPTRDRIFAQLARGVEVRDADLAAYLGSDGEDSGEGTDAILSLSDDDDEEEEDDDDMNDDDQDQNKKKKHKKVVLKRRARSRFESILNTIHDEKDSDKDNEDNEEEDIEIVFEPGLKSIGEEIVKKAKKKQEDNDNDESVWDSYLKKRREKRRERRKLKRQKENNGEDDNNVKDSLFQDDDIDQSTIMNDPFFADAFVDNDESNNTREHDVKKLPTVSNKKKKKRKHNELNEEEQKQVDALALLVDDEPTVGEYNLQDLVKEHKKKKKKKKKGKQAHDEVKPQDNYQFNVNDSRFAALFSDSKYHLDPTNPEFKDTAVSEAIVQERQNRRKKKRQQHNDDDNNNKIIMKQQKNRSVDALINSVKSKAKMLSKKKKKT